MQFSSVFLGFVVGLIACAEYPIVLLKAQQFTAWLETTFGLANIGGWF